MANTDVAHSVPKSPYILGKARTTSPATPYRIRVDPASCYQRGSGYLYPNINRR